MTRNRGEVAGRLTPWRLGSDDPKVLMWKIKYYVDTKHHLFEEGMRAPYVGGGLRNSRAQ